MGALEIIGLVVWTILKGVLAVVALLPIAMAFGWLLDNEGRHGPKARW